jgi:hypothetical protein
VNGVVELGVEPVTELFIGVKQIGHEEVQVRPDFHDVILQGSSSEKKLALGFEVKKHLPSLRFEILDILGFIEDDVVPPLAFENRVILYDQFIGSDTDVKSIRFVPTVALGFTFFLIAIVRQNFEPRTPLLKFYFPVDDDRSGDYNKMRPPISSFSS